MVPFLTTPFRSPRAGPPHALCRLGLATRGRGELTPDDVFHAVECGVNFLNWCGAPDGLSRAIADMGDRRKDVVVCVQFEARTSTDAATELRQILRELHTDYVDVLTFYYVEEPDEWRQLIAPGGALETCNSAQRDGVVRMLGLTSHQRPLAAEAARSGLLDMLMIRYNSAHRGAEIDVFPATAKMDLPVVVYTCLRWGAPLRDTGRPRRVCAATGAAVVSLRAPASGGDRRADGAGEPSGTR